MTVDQPDFTRSELLLTTVTTPTVDQPDFTRTAYAVPGSGGTGTISDITSADGSVLITDPTGPTTDLSVTSSGRSLLGLFQYAPASAGTVVNLLQNDFNYLESSTGDPLTVSFTTNPAGQGSTQVLVRLSGAVTVIPNANSAAWMGVMNHAGGAVLGDIQFILYIDTTPIRNDITAVYPFSCAVVVSGLTANTAYQFDWAGAGYTSGASPPYMATQAVSTYSDTNVCCQPTMEVWAA